MAEKRILHRHRRRMTLKFGIDDPIRVAFTEDISSDGMFIKSANTCPPKSKITIELNAPGNMLVKLEAVVMWSKKVPPNVIHLAKGGMGVRITRFLEGEAAYKKLCGLA